MARNPLNAGFTGDIPQAPGAVTKARNVVVRAKDEAGMVAAHAVDHPAATGSAVAIVGIVGLAVGYLLGVSSASRRRNWYR